jgi:hypothetical protein
LMLALLSFVVDNIHPPPSSPAADSRSHCPSLSFKKKKE